MSALVALPDTLPLALAPLIDAPVALKPARPPTDPLPLTIPLADEVPLMVPLFCPTRPPANELVPAVTPPLAV
jgi:hypothetical protein